MVALCEKSGIIKVIILHLGTISLHQSGGPSNQPADQQSSLMNEQAEFKQPHLICSFYFIYFLFYTLLFYFTLLLYILFLYIVFYSIATLVVVTLGSNLCHFFLAQLCLKEELKD